MRSIHTLSFCEFVQAAAATSGRFSSPSSSTGLMAHNATPNCVASHLLFNASCSSSVQFCKPCFFLSTSSVSENLRFLDHFSSCLYRNVAESPTAVATRSKEFAGSSSQILATRESRFCVASMRSIKCYFLAVESSSSSSPPLAFLLFFFFSFKACFSKTSSNSLK